MWLYTFKSQFVNVQKTKKKKNKSGHQGCDYKGQFAVLTEGRESF